MEILCRIEPQRVPLLSVPSPIGIDVCLDEVRLSRHIPEKLEVELVMVRSIRRHLHCHPQLISSEFKPSNRVMDKYAADFVNRKLKTESI